MKNVDLPKIGKLWFWLCRLKKELPSIVWSAGWIPMGPYPNLIWSKEVDLGKIYCTICFQANFFIFGWNVPMSSSDQKGALEPLRIALLNCRRDLHSHCSHWQEDCCAFDITRWCICIQIDTFISLKCLSSSCNRNRRNKPVFLTWSNVLLSLSADGSDLMDSVVLNFLCCW